MACILFPSPIFGPVHSRRLGTSLGINLLPADRKVCSFDCIYCECGFNKDYRSKPVLPTREEVRKALEKKLIRMKESGEKLDVLTFAGNGEPTSHPDFAEIIGDTAELRDRYFPDVKISVLSNSTFLHKPSVRDALKKADNIILKLDTADADYIAAVDRPNAGYRVEEIIDRIASFKGKAVVQTMFLKGDFEGKKLDNTSDSYVSPWLAALEKIRPKSVMIYTIDRETPAKGLKKATPEELDRIAEKVRQTGLDVSVSY